MGGGGRGTLAQHVPFDLAAFVPPFTFFFFPTFVPEGGGRGDISWFFSSKLTEARIL